MLEALGQLRRLVERPRLLTQHLLLLQLPAVGVHPLHRSSRHHPLATGWIPWPSSLPSPPPPFLSSSGREAGWSGPQRPPLRRPPEAGWMARRPPRPTGLLREEEDEIQKWDTSPKQSKGL